MKTTSIEQLHGRGDARRAILQSGAAGEPRTRRVVRALLFLLLLVALVGISESQIESVYHRHRQGADFNTTIYTPGSHVLDGSSPYQDPAAADFSPDSTYPPPIFLASAPLSSLPFRWALLLWQALIVASAVAVLMVLKIRDPICWGLWLLSSPVVDSVAFGNITPLVITCAAVLWRWRDRAWIAGSALAVAITIKLFLAPLLLWLVVTRRFRAATISVVTSTTLIFAGWSVIGFNGMADYPHILSRLSELKGGNGSFVQGLVRQLGGDRMTALGVGILCAVMLTFLLLRVSDDLTRFTLGLVICLALSPIVWLYYLGLLVVPIGVLARHVSRVWLTVPALWILWTYGPLTWASWEESLAVLIITGFLLFEVLTRIMAPTPAGQEAHV